MESKGDPAGPMSHPALRVPAVQSLCSMFGGGRLRSSPRQFCRTTILAGNRHSWGFLPSAPQPASDLSLLSSRLAPRPLQPPPPVIQQISPRRGEQG